MKMETSQQVFGDCPAQQIVFHDKFERTEQNSNCIVRLQFPKHSSEMGGGFFWWMEGTSFLAKKILQRRNITIGTNKLSTTKRSSSYFGGEHNMSRGSHLHLDCKVEKGAESENRW